jgi:hypothetical protein
MMHGADQSDFSDPNISERDKRQYKVFFGFAWRQ